jgi:hypothetical protein
MNAFKSNNNSSSAHADASIITNGPNRLEVTHNELVAIDTWLRREIPALTEKVYRQAPPVPKFSLDNPPDPRYLGPEIEKLNERSRKYNQSIENAKVNTTSANRIGRLTISTNALGETTLTDGKNTIEARASFWTTEREACESCQRQLRVEQIVKVFGEFPRNTKF